MKAKHSFLSLKNEKNTEFSDPNKECFNEIISENLLENLNKPLSNYNYSAILNQNFTENFKLKHPLEKKMTLRKAFSTVLEENTFNFEFTKGIENKTINSNSEKKNSVLSPKIEKLKSESTISQQKPLKKISIDGMNAFGFDVDLEANDQSHNVLIIILILI